MSSREAGPVVELVFRLAGEDDPFVRVSDREDCRLELLRVLPRGRDRYAEFFSVTDADFAAVCERVEAAESLDGRLLAREGSTGIFEFEVDERCPAVDLATLAAIPQTQTCEGGRGRIEATLVPPPDPATVVEAFTEQYPDATLVELSETDRSVPLLSGRELSVALRERLTDRQLEVLRRAYEAGYYERPRESTGEEVAAELDISVATFSQHVRAAERHLLGLVFEHDVT